MAFVTPLTVVYFRCDVYLSPDELKRLWPTFPVSADGMFNFSTLVRYYTDYQRVPVKQSSVPQGEW